MTEWLRRDKWLGFYDGSHAPHLPNGEQGSLGLLPWRHVGQASTPLVEFIASGALDPAASAIELGCGTGENLVCLAAATSSAVGVDIAPLAVEAARKALADAGATNARAVVVDLLGLDERSADDLPLTGLFDFALDCQTYQCLRQVDVAAAGAAVASVLRPGGTLLLLTGNSDEPDERGPVRLSRENLIDGLTPAGLEMVSCEPFHFDMTEAYRRQKESKGYEQTPLGWKSVWRKAR